MSKKIPSDFFQAGKMKGVGNVQEKEEKEAENASDDP